MNVDKQIKKYMLSLPLHQSNDLQALHSIIMQTIPNNKLWFLDSKNSENKIVSNPNIGYGVQSIKYADGKTREFYQLGISANKTGISIYIIGISDKKYLIKTFGEKIGKASVSGYCIKFKKLGDINLDVLEDIIRYSIEQKL